MGVGWGGGGGGSKKSRSLVILAYHIYTFLPFSVLNVDSH